MNADEPTTHESPRALVRQSEAKRNQVPQSEAKVCRRRKCNLEKTSLTTQIRGCVLVPRTQQLLDEVFVISTIIKCLGKGYQPKAEADNPYLDLDYSGYHKNQI